MTYGVYLILSAIIYVSVKNHITFDAMKSNIPEIMKTTLTFSSILFGFFGTLLGQIIGLKSKYSEDKSSSITFFFENVSSQELKFILLTNILNVILLDILSMFILLNGVVVKKVFIVWGYIFFAFVFHQFRVYKLFVDLMLAKTKIDFLEDEKVPQEELDVLKKEE